MNEQQLYVFNQYYIDFLKKVKALSKDKKDFQKEARDILRAIRKNYTSMDKLSHDYVDFLNKQSFWESYNANENKEVISDSLLEKELYEDISVKQVTAIFKTNDLLLHYLCLMDMFMTPDIPVEQIAQLVQKLSNAKEFEEGMAAITDELLLSKLKHLLTLHKNQTASKFEEDIKEIEQTSLGSLAKEILKDIDINDLQNTLAGEGGPNIGNIFSSLQDSSSGLGKVINTVSQSMISKLANGDIKQDDLLKDAMSLATKLPGMLPGGMGSQLGNLGDMLQQFQQMGGADFMKNMGFSGSQKNAAGGRLHSASRRQKTADRLRKKLDKNRENNIQTEVEEHHD